jgi:hypothetical protein
MLESDMWLLEWLCQGWVCETACNKSKGKTLSRRVSSLT